MTLRLASGIKVRVKLSGWDRPKLASAYTRFEKSGCRNAALTSDDREKAMSIRDAQDKLRILYGLSQNEPTPYQIRKWRERVRVLMNQGLSSDDAGDRASQEIFTTDMTHNYAAQPDTIHDILNDIDKD